MWVLFYRRETLDCRKSRIDNARRRFYERRELVGIIMNIELDFHILYFGKWKQL